MNIYRKLKSI